MDFKNIIGHEEIISRFLSNIETDHVSHSAWQMHLQRLFSASLKDLTLAESVNPVSRQRAEIILISLWLRKVKMLSSL